MKWYITLGILAFFAGIHSYILAEQYFPKYSITGLFYLENTTVPVIAGLIGQALFSYIILITALIAKRNRGIIVLFGIVVDAAMFACVTELR